MNYNELASLVHLNTGFLQITIKTKPLIFGLIWALKAVTFLDKGANYYKLQHFPLKTLRL